MYLKLFTYFHFPILLIKHNLFVIYKIFFKFNIIKVKPEMGREPKHGFVGWLEFKQKIAMKSESKGTHLPKSGQLPKWLCSSAALSTHLPYRCCKNKAQTPFCPPQHVPP